MNNKYYARQIDPEYQEDDLFYNYKDKNGRYQIGMNDDYYEGNIIIFGNRDYMTISTDEYDSLARLDMWEYECVVEHWDNVTQFIEYYLGRKNGKKYSTREIHEWKDILNDWDISDEEKVCKALRLMTGKTWRKVCIRGYCQSEWNYMYVSEDISDEGVDYIEMCFFNKGQEYIVYESEEDFNNEENGYSVYVEDSDQLKKEYPGIQVYEFDEYSNRLGLTYAFGNRINGR